MVGAIDEVKEMDARWIATGCLYTRFDGTGGFVFGSDQDDVSLRAGCTIRHGSARGDTGGKVKGDEGFTEAGVAVKDGQVAARDAFFPEPMELL